MEVVEWLILLIGFAIVIALEAYGFRVAMKADRVVDKTEGLVEQAEIELKDIGLHIKKTLNDEITVLNKIVGHQVKVMNEKMTAVSTAVNDTTATADEILEDARDSLKKVRELADPGVIAAIGELTIIKSLESLGMSNLKDLGDKGRAISNAKIGLQVVGDKVAQGAGVNDLIKQFAPIGEKIGQGSELLQNPAIQLLAQMFGFDLGGGGASIKQAGSAQSSGVVKELTK